MSLAQPKRVAGALRKGLHDSGWTEPVKATRHTCVHVHVCVRLQTLCVCRPIIRGTGYRHSGVQMSSISRAARLLYSQGMKMMMMRTIWMGQQEREQRTMMTTMKRLERVPRLHLINDIWGPFSLRGQRLDCSRVKAQMTSKNVAPNAGMNWSSECSLM